MFEGFDPVLFLRDFFINLGLSDALSLFTSTILVAILVVLLSWLAYLMTRFVVNRVITRIVIRTRVKWDDIFVESKLFSRLSHIAPALVIWAMAGWVLEGYPVWLELVQRLTFIYMIVAGTMFLYSFIDAWHKIYETLPISENRHIKGYVQLVKIFVAVIAVLLSVAIIFNSDIKSLVTGLGAMAAVLILVFRDTILGLVASIQLSANKLVKVGDWIELPARGVDGTITDISLNTVKIQNWDKTISSIPTYTLVQESLTNWKGMEESGGRRIKRALYIDMNSVRFIDEELKERLLRIQILRDYIERKDQELKGYNKEKGIDEAVLVNGRRMTNLGTFRAYVEAYLHNHPLIHDDMTFLVRHLQPTRNGLPIEIYVFSKDQAWARYESIQADIFDHLLAVIPEFGLRVFQSPSGEDIKHIGKEE